MPYKEKTITKLYWSIGEVATELGVNTSLIRYWEKEFGSIKPRRNAKGDRLFTEKEIERLRQIQHLVKEEGFTLQGAKEKLRKAEATEAQGPDLRERLLGIREKLEDLRRHLDEAT